MARRQFGDERVADCVDVVWLGGLEPAEEEVEKRRQKGLSN